MQNVRIIINFRGRWIRGGGWVAGPRASLLSLNLIELQKERHPEQSGMVEIMDLFKANLITIMLRRRRRREILRPLMMSSKARR